MFFECGWCHEQGDEAAVKAHKCPVKPEGFPGEPTPTKMMTLLEAAEWALRGLELLATEEAKASGSTFELCDYTFAKGLREAIAREKS